MSQSNFLQDRCINITEDQSLFNVAPIAILKLDFSYTIVDINPAAEKLIGLKDTLINRPVEELCFNEADKNSLRNYLKTISANHIDINIKSRLFVSVHVNIRLSQSHNVYYCFLNKHIKFNSIKKELLYYRKALDALNDGAILFDQDGLIFYANSVAQKNLTSQSKTILGMNIKQIWAQNHDCPEPNWWKQLTSGHSFTGSFSMPHLTADEGNYNIYINPLSDDIPNTLGYVCLQKRT